jgi:hypothetical protein
LSSCSILSGLAENGPLAVFIEASNALQTGFKRLKSPSKIAGFEASNDFARVIRYRQRAAKAVLLWPIKRTRLLGLARVWSDGAVINKGDDNDRR